MARQRLVAAKGAVLIAAVALLTSGLQAVGVLPGAAPAASAAPAQKQVLSNDFESTFAPWTPMGPPTLALTTESAHGGSSSLAVTGRTGNWNGAQVTDSILTVGAESNFSAWVRLAAGTAGSTEMKFTVKYTDSSGATQYKGAGSPAMVSASGWTQIGGAYTVPEGSTGVAFYIEAADIGDVHPSFLIDDVTVTTAAPATDEVVSSLDFENGAGWEPWTQDGNPTLAVVVDPTDSSNHVLSITGRTQDYEGIQSPVIFTAGKTYTLSMDVRLAPGVTGSAQAHFTARAGYTWLGNDTVTADAWTKISATWTPAADADPSQLWVYIGTNTAVSGLLVDNILITTPKTTTPTQPPGTVMLETGFENGLDGWVARQGSSANGMQVGTSTAYAHGGSQSACVTNRQSTGDGLAFDVTTLLEAGQTYDISAWVRFADGAATDDVWLTMATTTGSASTAYTQAGQFTGVTNSGWTQVTAKLSIPTADNILIYFETNYNHTNTSTFCVDDIKINTPETAPDLTLTPIKETTDFRVGIAASPPQLAGQAANLLLHHYNQVTPENGMKVESWYNADKVFGMSPDADATMQFGVDNGIPIYGHTLVWHSQTPDWFFQDASGRTLTNSAADQQLLTERLRTHIFSVAKALSDKYGKFGSAGNPLVAFDVVNEVIADSASTASGGLRTSLWQQILGPKYIELAFQYAEEAFNHTYAVDQTSRPVKLFFNEYDTEAKPDKLQRVHDTVKGLLDKGIPVDGIGHQFHVTLATPVASLSTALNGLADLGLLQAVTELDVPTGTPVTEAKLIEQGYYYQDAFNAFRAWAATHPGKLFSVTMWGLDDDQSWRNSAGAPLPFDGDLQAKPGYWGIVNGELPPLIKSANVFGDSVPATAAGATSSQWDQLPQFAIGGVGTFQSRWQPDRLTVDVRVSDTAASAADKVTFQLGSQTYTVGRDGTVTGGITAAVVQTSEGYTVIANLPLSNAKQGDILQFDVRINGAAGATVGWNSAGAVGTLTLVEAISFQGVPEVETAPVIDGDGSDAAWANAAVVTTAKLITGDASGAIGTAKLVWKGDTLYLLVDVVDPAIDATSNNAYEQDSVEIYVDRGNSKNGGYLVTDTQMRVGADNAQSFGSGDAVYQATLLKSATKRTSLGYAIEAAISLDELGGALTYHGFDVQVNDATAGVRTSLHNWADPTNAGYQSTAHWGVIQLLPLQPLLPQPAPPVRTPDTGGTVVGGDATMLALLGIGMLAAAGLLVGARTRVRG